MNYKHLYEEFLKEKFDGIVKCLNCGREIEIKLRHTGIHQAKCPWNYYIECENCGYQNNVAKYLKMNCVCRRE